MNSDVAFLEWLEVDWEAEEDDLDRGETDDGAVGRVVEDDYDEGEDDLFWAWDEKEVFGSGLVVGAYEIVQRGVALILHPLGLHHLLPTLQHQQHNHYYLRRQRPRREERPCSSKVTTKCQVEHLCEYIYIDLDEWEVEEDDDDVETEDVGCAD